MLTDRGHVQLDQFHTIISPMRERLEFETNKLKLEGHHRIWCKDRKEWARLSPCRNSYSDGSYAVSPDTVVCNGCGSMIEPDIEFVHLEVTGKWYEVVSKNIEGFRNVSIVVSYQNALGGAK